MKHPYILLFYIPIILLPLLGLFSGPNFYLNFLVVLLFNILIMSDMKDKRRYALSPTFVTILYLYISFTLGEVLFYNEIYRLFPLQNEYYESWKFLPQNVAFYNFSSLLIVLSYLNARSNIKLDNGTFFFSWKYIFIGLVLLVLVLFIRIPITALSFAVPFFSIGLIYLVSKIESQWRFFVYLFIMALMMALNPDDKRETIFLFYPIMFLEFIRIKKISFKSIMVFISGGVVIVVAVVIMSIIRAELSSSIFITKDIIVQYITSDIALASFADNFEINWCYIDAFQPMEFINADSSNISWGSSFLKPLFWPISRDIWPNKPESTMLLFTSLFDKSAKEEGMSLPMPIVADMYWNFKYFSVIFIYIIHYWLNSMYKSTVQFYKRAQSPKIVSIGEFVGAYFLFVFLLFMRGCGIDMFLAYWVVFFVLLSLFKSIFPVRRNT